MGNESKNQLEELANASPTLSATNRAAILNQLANLSDEQIVRLQQIFIKEQSQLTSIKSKYSPQEVDLKIQYFEALEKSKHSGVHAALEKIEEKEMKNKEKELTNLLKELPVAKQVQKKSHKLLTIFSLLALVGLVVFILLYFKILS